MIDTSIFPRVEQLYPSQKIVYVVQAWKIGLGWCANPFHNLPVVTQIRKLKEHDYTKVELLIKGKHNETVSDFSISELGFSRPVKHRRQRRFASFYLL